MNPALGTTMLNIEMKMPKLCRTTCDNKELFKAWNGHINVHRVTKLGFVRYLVKYVSKIEPTFT